MQSEDTYNKAGFFVFLFSMTFSLCFFVYVGFVHPGIDLKEIPEQPTAGPADLAQNAVAFDPSKIEKPWVSTDELVAYGKKTFATNCAACHGTGGMGDGPAAAGLVPKPRNLVKGGWKQGGDTVSLYKTVQGGIPGSSMVGFNSLPKMDRWALVHFIRSITEDKPQDDLAKLEQFAATAQ